MKDSEHSSFESDVIPDSGKTTYRARTLTGMFESDVIPDSGKTKKFGRSILRRFESDVIPDSGKTTAIEKLLSVAV